MNRIKSFTYSPLGPREIRIITLLSDDYPLIRCTLHHASLDERPEYEALSYTWGRDSLDRTILIDGKRHGVGQNLWSALFHFRRNTIASETAGEQPSTPRKSKTPLKIWIDALCIDQKNKLERSSQVQMMGSIYTGCKKLRIWLGEQTPQTVAAIENFQVSESGIKIALDNYGGCICEVERVIKSKYASIAKFFENLSDLYGQITKSIEQLFLLRIPSESRIWGLESFKEALDENERRRVALATHWLSPTNEVFGYDILFAIRHLLLRLISNMEMINSYILDGNEKLQRGGNNESDEPLPVNNFLEIESLLQQIVDITEWIEKDSTEDDYQHDVQCLDSAEGLLDICQRSYWDRLWVIQEVVLGYDPIIYCGESYISWQKFTKFLSVGLDESSFKTDPDELETVPGFDVRFSPDVAEMLRRSPAAGFSKAYNNTVATGVGKISLRSLITSFHEAQTKDPRDMVYGLLSLAELSHSIMPDYSKSTADIYTEVLQASRWKQPTTWNGTDDYLVSFSQLLQKVLGEPFRDIEPMKSVSEGYSKDDIIVVTGIVGKRMSWEEPNLVPVANEPRPLTRTQQAQIKLAVWTGQKWVCKSALKKCPPTFTYRYRQNFKINPYYCHCSKQKAVHTTSVDCGTFQGEGSALLSAPSTVGDYLCFFKDCGVVAVVRANDAGTYSIIDNCLVEFLRTPFETRGANITPLENWTMKCEVEMSRETLQRLTM